MKPLLTESCTRAVVLTPHGERGRRVQGALGVGCTARVVAGILD